MKRYRVLSIALFCISPLLHGAQESVRFTFDRANALVCSAMTQNDFAAAADVYSSIISSGIDNPALRCDLAGTLFMAGDYRRAIDEYSKAERFSGVTPVTDRGIAAAYAALYKDPMLSTPPKRVVSRIVSAFSWNTWALIFATLWALAWLTATLRRLGAARKTVQAATAAAIAIVCTGFKSGETANGIVRCPVYLEFGIKSPENASIEIDESSLSGLPETAVPGHIEQFANSNAKNDGILYFRLPVTFNSPCKMQVALRAPVYIVNRTGTSVFKHGSVKMLGRWNVIIDQLPKENAPADFSGAIGSGFTLGATIDKTSLRVNDLATLTVTVKGRGYMPETALPIVEWNENFKTYPLSKAKEAPGKSVWTQQFIALSTNITEVAKIKFVWFDTTSHSYKTSEAGPIAVSITEKQAEKAQSVVLISERKDSPSEGINYFEIKFAPSDTSPTVGMAKEGEAKTIGEHGNWLRVQTDRTSGWIKKRD